MFCLHAVVDSLTRSMALEWGTDYGICVNGIISSPIEGAPRMDILSPNKFLGDLQKNQPLYKEGENGMLLWRSSIWHLTLVSIS